MHDIIILKAADDVDDSINLANMSKEFIPETLAAVRTANKTRYIDEFDRCRDKALWVIHLIEHIKPVVGNIYDADIRLDRAEGVVRSLCACFGDRIKKGAFTDIRKPDNA